MAAHVTRDDNSSRTRSNAVTGKVGSVTLPAVISLGGHRKGVSTCEHASICIHGEQKANPGAGGPAWTERLPVRFEWLAAA